MARSIRVFYQNRIGRVALNRNINGFNITNRSAVLVTAALWTPNPGSFGDLLDVRLRVHGPDVWVSNIVPHGGPNEASGVEFMLHVNSDQPEDFAVTITLLEPCEVAGSG
jgi:hypothetical protein